MTSTGTPKQHHVCRTRGEVYSGPDKWGNYHFALFWCSDYHPGHPEGEYRHAERGQHFLASLKEYEGRAEVWADKR